MKTSSNTTIPRSLFGSGGSMISDRLARLVRITVTAFVVLLVAYLISVVTTSLRVGAQRDLGSFALTVSEFEQQLLQMRRNEKDFLDRRNKAELEKHNASHDKAVAALQKARANPQATVDDIKQLDAVTQSVAAYRKAFLATADAQIALGLDENSGLQGALRKAVREAEASVLTLGLLEVEVGVLTLRRHEKDFILRERDEYVTKHAKEMTEVNKLVAGARIEPVVKQRLTELLATYDKSFREFVAGTFAVNKSIAEARAAAHAAEEPVPQIVAKAAERGTSAAAMSALTLTLSAVGVAAALIFVALLLWRSLGTVRRSITSSVGLLQDTVERVRAGEDVHGANAITTDDEMGLVWKSVDALLNDRLAAQRKAEAENEQLNNSVIAILQAENQLSQRDLTAKAPVSTDMIGTVSDSINALTDETTKVLRGVNLIAGEVARVSGNVKGQADLVSKTAEDDRQNVGLMIKSLGESTLSMNQMAVLAEQSNHSAGQATDATATALETVNATVKGMESIRETIAEAEKRIKRLGERSQEITGIVNLINTISERTHVLALNASMQAAVAGEAGRGFAVVAEEVQRLAESSRNATQQIGTLVNNIQLETNETISTVNRTIGQVVQGSEQAQKAGDQMRVTQGITAQLVAQVRRIGESSDQQKLMSAQMLESVQQMGRSSERTAQQIGAQNLETDSLLDSARRLVESVSVFKLPQAA